MREELLESVKNAVNDAINEELSISPFVKKSSIEIKDKILEDAKTKRIVKSILDIRLNYQRLIRSHMMNIILKD